MTIAIEVDGVKVEAETEKEARRELRRILQAKAKEDAKRSARYQRARERAESAAYRILSRKLSGEDFPRSWRFYAPDHKWADHIFRPSKAKCEAYGRLCAHDLNTEGGWLTWQHWGYEMIGAVCTGAGFCWLIFLRDRDAPHTVTCYAVGHEGDTLSLADCPSITPEDFVPVDGSPD